MYPQRKPKTQNLKQQKSDSIKAMVLEKLLQDYAGKNLQNKHLIQFYVEDFFLRQHFSEGALRALKLEVKAQVQKTREEKQLIIEKLQKQIELSMKNNHQGPSQLMTQSVGNLQDVNTQQSVTHFSDKKESTPIISHQTTEKQETQQRTKSVYHVEGNEDEWATIIKYDYALYKQQQEDLKNQLKQNKQRIREELDKQLQDKERKKKQEQENEFKYYDQTKRLQNEYDQQEESKKERMRIKQLEEKKQRDEQVEFERLKKKEQFKSNKQQDENLINSIKLQIQAESEHLNLKKKEQQQKFQLILKENEKLRIQALEEMKQQKEHETKLQQQYIKQLEQEEQKREAIKKEREDRVKNLMNNYSQHILKNEKEQKLKEEQKLLDEMKRQEQQSKEVEFRKKQLEKNKMELVKEELGKQIQQKKQRYNEEVDESNKILLKQMLEIQKIKEKESLKQQKVRQSYLDHAEQLKRQMHESRTKQTVQNKSMHEKMSDIELLHNKDILKKIANDSLIDATIKKSNF